MVVGRFAAPTRLLCVEYKRFCDCVEEAFSQPILERAPLLVPLQHVACHDGGHNFLNFEERQLVSLALENLAARPTEALMDVFQVCYQLGQTSYMITLFKNRVMIRKPTIAL